MSMRNCQANYLDEINFSIHIIRKFRLSRVQENNISIPLGDNASQAIELLQGLRPIFGCSY